MLTWPEEEHSDNNPLYLVCEYYRDLGGPHGVWVAVGVVVLLHAPARDLAVLRGPPATYTRQYTCY